MDIKDSHEPQRQILARHFSPNELRDLVFDMGENPDNFPNLGVDHLSREIIAYFERRGRMSELTEKLRELRPKAFQQDVLEASSSEHPTKQESAPKTPCKAVEAIPISNPKQLQSPQTHQLPLWLAILLPLLALIAYFMFLRPSSRTPVHTLTPNLDVTSVLAETVTLAEGQSVPAFGQDLVLGNDLIWCYNTPCPISITVGSPGYLNQPMGFNRLGESHVFAGRHKYDIRLVNMTRSFLTTKAEFLITRIQEGQPAPPEFAATETTTAPKK